MAARRFSVSDSRCTKTACVNSLAVADSEFETFYYPGRKEWIRKPERVPREGFGPSEPQPVRVGLIGAIGTALLMSAIIYTIGENCRLQDIHPLEYFNDVLPRIMEHPASRITELLPRQWKQARQ